MDAVFRSVAIYILLLIIFRLSGKRTLSQITTFDFVLLLIIGEAVQQGLLGDDFSVTNAIIIVVVLVAIDVGFALLKQRSPLVARLADGLPVIILENGKPIRERMQKARIDDDDILSTARRSQGIERLDQIKYAVLERDGGISIIPEKGAGS